jgi:hypothetical protein
MFGSIRNNVACLEKITVLKYGLTCRAEFWDRVAEAFAGALREYCLKKAPWKCFFSGRRTDCVCTKKIQVYDTLNQNCQASLIINAAPIEIRVQHQYVF